MKWAEDLQAQAEENNRKIEELIAASKKTEAVNATAAAQINRGIEIMRSLTSTCENAVESVKRLNNGLPEKLKIENEYKWGIKLPTMVWITCVLIALGLGFWLAPEAANTAKNQKLMWQLQQRENQIREFQKVHPKFTKQYFGD